MSFIIRIYTVMILSKFTYSTQICDQHEIFIFEHLNT